MRLITGVILPEIHRDPAKDVLFFASTGGSTGEPKCVMYSDNSFNLTVHQTLHSPLNYKAKDRWLRIWPIFNGASAIANHHMPLCSGMVMVSRNLVSGVEDLPNILISAKPNHIVLISQAFDAMEKSEVLKGQDMSFIVNADFGGTSITPRIEERVNSFFKEHGINSFVGYAWGCSESATSGAYRVSSNTAKTGSVSLSRNIFR